ncbi:MAG TPA: FAD-binding oxidoreductase [Candidatus Elarobacter sp.]|nr:FAD-binding oxidoreductase [Candidatus Elarobacter sp.]
MLEILQQTPTIKSFFLELEHPFSFTAGQHVDVRLTADDGYQALRSYSIGSSPSTPGKIELVIERLQDGEVSPFFHDVVAIGDRVELRGPIGGYFIWAPADGGPVLLVGGGSGVVPLMAMLRHRKAANVKAPALLLLSARTWDDVLFRDELFELGRDHDGFDLVLTLTREAAREGVDFSRRVDTPMMADVLARLPASPAYTFICGANPFVDAVADGALAAQVPEGSIRTERYGV